MNYVQDPLCNAVLGAPPGTKIEECHALPVLRFVEDGREMVASFWKPDAEELAALNAGKSVVVMVWGTTQAPMMVAVRK